MFTTPFLVWSGSFLSYSSDHLSCHTRPGFPLYSQSHFTEFNKKQRGFIQTYLLEGKMKNTSRVGETTFTVQTATVFQLSRQPTGHRFAYHPLGHLAHKRRPGLRMFWALVDECVVQTGPASEARDARSSRAMSVLMPSCMFYCQITALVQIIYSTTPTPGGLIHRNNISTALTSRMLDNISVTENVCWAGHQNWQKLLLNVSSERPVTSLMPCPRLKAWMVEMGNIQILTTWLFTSLSLSYDYRDGSVRLKILCTDSISLIFYFNETEFVFRHFHIVNCQVKVLIEVHKVISSCDIKYEFCS